MNHRTSIAAPLASLLCMVLTLFAPGCEKHPQEKQAIRASWKTYNESADNMDGPAQASVLSKSTLEHYDRRLKAALNGTAAEVMAMPPNDQHEIILMRNRATRKQLQGYNGKGYAIYATKQGWWSGYGNDEWELKSIRVSGDTADAKMTEVIPAYVVVSSGYRSSLRQSARIHRNRKPREYPVRFVLEEGTWKVDETTLMPKVNEELIAGAKEARMSMRDFLMAWEEDESGKEVTIKIWEPMK